MPLAPPRPAAVPLRSPPTLAVSRVGKSLRETEIWAADLTVLVPVGPGDAAWRALLGDLSPLLSAGGRAVLCGTEAAPTVLPNGACWVRSGRANRAAQLNAAAAAARTGRLWCLHADTRLAPAAVRAAVEHASDPRAVHFLRLHFAADGPALTRLNGWGANLRSRALKMPFGDQGFLLSAALLSDLGGFDEAAPYGEGHLLAWAARRRGVRLVRLPASLTTSARKYRRRGWGRTTALHLFLTVKQAAPQWWALVRGR